METLQIQKLMDINPDPVLIAEKKTGRIKFFNNVFGNSIKEVKGMNVANLFDLTIRSEKDDVHSFLEGESRVGDFHFRLGDGKLSKHKLYADEFDTESVIISFKDEQGIPKTDFQTKLLDNLNDAVIAANINLDITAWNKAAERIYGWTKNEALGQNMNSLLQTQMTEAERKKYLFDMENQGSVQQTVTRRHKGGKPVFIEANTISIHDSNGKVSGYVSVNRDITAKLETIEKLVKTEERFKLVADNTNDLIAMASGKKYLYLSPSFEKIFGYTIDELKKIGLLSLVHPGDRPLLENWENSGMLEFRVKNKKGDMIWLEGESFEITGDPKIAVGIARNITKRKLAQEALKESEERYRLLFERNPLPMFVYDEETLRFVAVNESAVNHYGYTKDEILQMSIMDIRPEEDIPRLRNYLKIQNQGINRFGIWRHFKKDGSIIDVEITSHRIIFNGKQARLALANDVTEKFRAEKARKESEEKYRRIVENANEGILLTDAENLITFVNSKFAKILGFKKEELEKRNVLELIFDSDRQSAENYIRQNSEGNRETFHFRLRHKDGSERWIQSNAVPVFDEDDNYAGGLALITDITEQRKAEAVYQRNNEMLRALINYSPLSIIILDKDGKVELWNPASEKIFGWSSKEVLGIPLPTVPEDKAEEHAGLRSTIMRGESFTGKEVKRQTKSGKKIDVSISASPLFDSDHHPIGISSFLSDVTDRKNAEKEREKLFKQINNAKNRLKILSAKLLSVQEIEKRNISRELHDEIGQMLTAIKIDLQRIRTETDSKEIITLADDCNRLVESTISVVRNLSLELRPSIIDDLGLAASLRWYADKFYQRTGIEVKTEINKIDKALPPECAITLFRICQEALTNIAKHAEADYVKVTLNQNKDLVSLTVKDNGKGFDLQKALKLAAKGKSLGLLGMQERAELLGGKFRIKSSEDSGTVIKATCQI